MKKYINNINTAQLIKIVYLFIVLLFLHSFFQQFLMHKKRR